MNRSGSIAAELCSEIRRRLADGRLPLKYMNLTRGFQLRVDDTSNHLVLMLTSDPTTWEEVGYCQYDQRLPGMRWILSANWRGDVKFLLCRLGMYDSQENTEEVPF